MPLSPPNPPTWGTIAKESWPELAYFLLSSQNEVGWGIIQDNSGGSGIFIIERWWYDSLFFSANYVILAGDERGLTRLILQVQGQWDTQVYSPGTLDAPNLLTWARLEAGGSIVVGGQTFTGDQAVEVLLQQFYQSASTFQVESATQKWLDWVQAQAQAGIDATVNSWPTPPAPAPYQPPQFHPGSHGEILLSVVLETADNERARTGVDATGRVLVSFAPVVV